MGSRYLLTALFLSLACLQARAEEESCEDKLKVAKRACTTTDMSAGLKPDETVRAQQTMISNAGIGQQAGKGGQAQNLDAGMKNSENLRDLSGLKALGCERARTACYQTCDDEAEEHKKKGETDKQKEAEEAAETCRKFKDKVDEAAKQAQASEGNRNTNESGKKKTSSDGGGGGGIPMAMLQLPKEKDEQNNCPPGTVPQPNSNGNSNGNSGGNSNGTQQTNCVPAPQVFASATPSPKTGVTTLSAQTTENQTGAPPMITAFKTAVTLVTGGGGNAKPNEAALKAAAKRSRDLSGMSVKAVDGITGPNGPSLFQKISTRFQKMNGTLVEEPRPTPPPIESTKEE